MKFNKQQWQWIFYDWANSGYGILVVTAVLPVYFTTAVFYGPDIKKRDQVEHAELVDEGPTFAELLGLSYPRPTAGKPIKGIFKKVKHEI